MPQLEPTHLEHYFLAEFAMKRWVRGDREAAEEALFHARKAIAVSPSPRSVYFTQLKSAALATADKETELTAVEAMVAHWPFSAAAWSHKAMSCQGVDNAASRTAAQESLRMQPDNFFGLLILGQLAKTRGDSVAAAKFRSRAAELYPEAMRFSRSAAPHTR